VKIVALAEVLALVDARDKQLEGQINALKNTAIPAIQRSIETAEKNNELFEEAKRLIDARNYDTCVTTLKKQVEPRSEAAILLLARATLHRDAKAVLDNALTLTSAVSIEVAIAELDKILSDADQSGVPPQETNEYRKQRPVLVVKVGLARFQEEPTGNLKTWLGKAHAMMTSGNAAVRAAVVEAVERRLTDPFNEKKQSKLDDKEELVTNKKIVVTGVFNKIDGGREYHYWESADARRKNPTGWETYVGTEVVRPPAQAEESLCVEEYHTQLRFLKGHLRTKSAWQDMQTKLEEWQKRLKDRRDLGAKYSVDFNIELQFVNQVVDEAWPQVEEVFAAAR
jgi:hypothetical protein